MSSMAGTSAVATAHAHPRRRAHPRYALRSLAYIKLDNGNGGIIRDITEEGLALQAVAPLSAGQEVILRFDLLSPRLRVDTPAEVIWSDPSGRAGIRFCQPTVRQTRGVRDWIFFQIFSAAAVSGRDSIFQPLDQQLMVSAQAQAAIVLDPPLIPIGVPEKLRWGFFAFSIPAVSFFIDILVLLCAILLFCVGAIAMMNGVPPWPLAVAALLTSSAIFVAAYQLLFSEFLCGPTPGKRLAHSAAGRSDDGLILTRFR